MKVLFVVDTEKSALHTSAQQWCKEIGGRTLVATNFSSFGCLLNCLLTELPDIVFFSWRQVLDQAFLSKRNLQKLEKLTSQTKVFALIADHTGEDIQRMARDYRLFQANIGLVPVSHRLYEFYSSVGLNPIGILPDRPDIELIREVRDRSPLKVVNSVIWVGNSAWGKRQGYTDHKGLRSKFEPFLNLASRAGLNLKPVTIDSSSHLHLQREVLQRLAESELLIVTSRSEGTGLPILEALGVGTNVLASDVGVSDILNVVKVLPTDASPEDYFEAYLEWKTKKSTPEECVLVFENYLDYVNQQWNNLMSVMKIVPNEPHGEGRLLEDGNQRVFNLLLWNLKFFLRWVQGRYAK